MSNQTIVLEEQEVLNDLLGYEGLQIIQRKDMLNFSLDCVLLSDFVTLPAKAKTIFDFGTGNAPIPLFLSTRSQAKIIGLDVQPEAIKLAKRNIDLNKLTAQVEINEVDIRQLPTHYAAQVADVVVSNPPFFRTTEQRQLNENELLTIARHEVKLDLATLIKQAAYLLNNNGYFAMVHRPDRLIEIITLLQQYKLEPKRLQFIYPKVGSEANMLLIEARRNGNPGMKILPPIIVHEADGHYRPEILTLFKRTQN